MSPVGLDLGRSSITAVRLRHQTGGSELLQVSLDTLPEGLIQEGEVRDVEARLRNQGILENPQD